MMKGPQIATLIGAIILIGIFCFFPTVKQANSGKTDEMVINNDKKNKGDSPDVLNEQGLIEAEIQLAIEKVNSENPMEGIMMLKEIATEYPNNTTPLFYLGLFSFQSGQFKKAVSRFNNILMIDSSMIDAHLFLGESLLEIGDTSSAISELYKYIAKEKDQDKLAQANMLINKLN